MRFFLVFCVFGYYYCYLFISVGSVLSLSGEEWNEYLCLIGEKNMLFVWFLIARVSNLALFCICGGSRFSGGGVEFMTRSMWYQQINNGNARFMISGVYGDGGWICI